MPRMDGITFLEKLMRAHPMPVVMVSSLTQTGVDVTLRALELGAVDFFPNPTLDTVRGVAIGASVIIEKVKAAAKARVHPRVGSNSAPTSNPALNPSNASLATVITEGPPVRRATAAFGMTHKIIAIGASTGGTEAVREVLTQFPADTPGIVVVQHMPPGFTASFAARLDSLCQIRVKEAQDGDKVLPGQALIAPGSLHMAVQRSGAEYVVRVFNAQPVNHHRPSVDVLFDSAAEQVGKNAIAVILTGMGDDGARGMKRMRDAGARTIAQDEASCVVFGMPKEAITHGGAEFVLPLNRIGSELLALVRSGPSNARAA
jgi:two-component system chemotaxis response regulator CheB